MAANILLLSDDLIDSSKITAPARDAGRTVFRVRTAAEIISRLADHPELVIVDLHVSGNELPAILEAIRNHPHRPQTIGFGSHVHAETLSAARRAGCDLVLPRSAFFERVAELVCLNLPAPS